MTKQENYLFILHTRIKTEKKVCNEAAGTIRCTVKILVQS